ncbi:MAG: LLM class flavin-dependent oxidoreductase [Thermomicrobiales bacterium]|nr:LLM class flavin-dependent oxidoreductase [Thermomicrobiales bacterium]
MRFHIQIVPNTDWETAKARVLEAEALGFEAVALADHLVDWTDPSRPWFEAWSSLAALAEATRTIRLTTVVTQIPLRNPAMLARQVLTLDHISRGRIELGLGTGLTIDPSYAMAGLPNWTPAERVARFAEYCELVSLLLSQEVTTYHGTYYAVEGTVLRPRSLQQPRPPLLVAALGPRMLALAARFADRWNSLSFQPEFAAQLAETRRRSATLDAACAAIGRDPATLTRSYTMFDAQARPRGGAMSYLASPEAFVDQASQIAALGVRDIGVYYPADPAQHETFQRVATESLPQLRAAFPG